MQSNMARDSFPHISPLLQSYRPARAFVLYFKIKTAEGKVEKCNSIAERRDLLRWVKKDQQAPAKRLRKLFGTKDKHNLTLLTDSDSKDNPSK